MLSTSDEDRRPATASSLESTATAIRSAIASSGPDHPYLIVQRQFEDDDGGVCYIETHDHDTYTGHFRLRLIEFTPTRLAFEIARRDHRYVEVTCDLDAKRFGDVQRIVRIVFGVES